MCDTDHAATEKDPASQQEQRNPFLPFDSFQRLPLNCIIFGLIVNHNFYCFCYSASSSIIIRYAKCVDSRSNYGFEILFESKIARFA